MKAKPIDELCGKQGSLKKFLKEKQAFVKKLEEKQKARIRSGQPCKQAAWAA